MSKVHNQVDQNSAVKKASAKWEKWLFWPLALGISSFFIYLEISGVDTTQAALNFALFLLFFSVLFGSLALIILIFSKFIRFLTSK